MIISLNYSISYIILHNFFFVTKCLNIFALDLLAYFAMPKASASFCLELILIILLIFASNSITTQALNKDLKSSSPIL